LFTAIAFSALVVTLASNASAGPKYKVLHAFTGGNDGGGLWGSLLLDQHGNVYGTTISGGPKGKGGTAFKLTRQANGTWSQTVLYNFCSRSGCADGGGPFAGLIFDAAGNLYGTTESGGAHVYGTVFELTPGSDGWKENVLHSFGFNSHGCCPKAGVVMDNAGNLFGTASVAFELSPGTSGWKETVLHNFTGHHGDGSGPWAGMILDEAGNAYGTTEMGGTNRSCGGGCGTVYELEPISGGGWKEHILHDFGTVGDGAFPGVGALILDSAGNLYGTTNVGGATGYGTVFRLTLQSSGRWKETILHSFAASPNGQQPSASVVMDKAGNLYGTTISGGTASCGCGVIYKLVPGSNGKWTYTVLHRFTGYDGAQPDANLILDGKGNLYGTTITGGTGGAGVAFELTP
jgi:uncharacterized repeat protein (TIGR03803 family)